MFIVIDNKDYEYNEIRICRSHNMTHICLSLVIIISSYDNNKKVIQSLHAQTYGGRGLNELLCESHVRELVVAIN